VQVVEQQLTNYHSNQPRRQTELWATFSVTNVTKKETRTNPEELVDSEAAMEDLAAEEDSNPPKFL
jgi:hypothetical protein